MIPNLSRSYEQLHQKICPEIEATIIDSGIVSMEIYRIGIRLFMIMDTTDDFSFEAKSKDDTENPKAQEWENFVWQYQQAIPMAKEGEKWVLMNKIFDLKS